MLIQDRIQLIIKANRLTATEFATKIGVKRSNLSHVLSGRNKPSLDFLAKVVTAYPNVNASWLLTGETREGDFEPNPTVEENKKSNEVKSVDDSSQSSNIEKIVVFYKDKSFKEYLPNEQ